MKIFSNLNTNKQRLEKRAIHRDIICIDKNTFRKAVK